MSLEKVVDEASDHGQSVLKRIDYLDGWRGMAILLVLANHFLHVDSDTIDVGRMGVDVFFVLSGTLMANILFVKKTPIPTFYKRRISRILPVFFIFTSLLCLLSLTLHLSNEHVNYFYTLFFLRAYLPADSYLWDTGLPIGHLWSLNVEEHCYLVLSLVALIPFLQKRACIVVMVLGVLSILLQVLYVEFPAIATANYDIKTEIVSSFIMISAGYSLIKHRVESYIPNWLPLVTLLLVFICYSEYSPHWAAKWMVSPFLLAFTVNHLNIVPEFFKSALSFMPLRLVGLWSFSIYLWQQPLYFYGTRSGDAFLLAGPVLLVVSVVIGMASFYLIENPIRRYLNNNW